ncbi:MAG: amidase [Piscinibacter sp.]|uniref:amidase n=1 Tax=Piscinibacter sp. TaxID=1903157 RepID=UPI0035AE701C
MTPAGGTVHAASLPLPEFERLDATALADELRRGRITALEALEAAIARVEARSALNALAARHFDTARETAKQLSALGRAERQRRASAAPLLGVPFALKDLGVSLNGTVTTNGCGFFRDAVADHDSTLVQRHRAAGLNLFAKTTTPEFGQTATTESRLFGPTRNPWNVEHSAGGSSGGAAAVVAAGVIPVAHATDGGGSIRIPASACGLFGLKTSRGRVPAGPVMIEASLGLSVHHVLSRSVRDSALLLELTQGPEPGSRIGAPVGPVLADLTRPPGPLRIALLEDNLFGVPVHPDCLDAVRRAARLCESLGHHVQPAPRPLLRAEVVGPMYAGMGVATATGMLLAVSAREKVLGRSARADEFEPINWRALQLARGYSAEQALAARAAFDQAGRAFDLFFAEHDILLSPTMAAPPPRLGALSLDQPYDDYVKAAVTASAFTSMFNISGHPAMSVPLHWNAAGLPIGVQFGAAFGAEARLLALAAQLERAAPWHDRRPAP